MCLDKPHGTRFGDRVVTCGAKPSLRVGPQLLGRVIDAKGQPLDSLGEYPAVRSLPVDVLAPAALDRTLIDEPLGCGIRAVDAFLTCGRGQRVGIFGGSGVGKSTLIGMMARGTAADLTVLALVGERGREVGEFLETLGEEGRRRSVVIVSTSDQSPLLRIRAALAATAVAEYFSGLGKNVLLVVDSLTRFAMAQREIGLAAGEPPTAKGYTPSVLTMLAKMVERAGRFANGSITAFYTVLMEGDDQQDPIVDTVRSLLDGHIVLRSQARPRQPLSAHFRPRQPQPVDAERLLAGTSPEGGRHPHPAGRLLPGRRPHQNWRLSEGIRPNSRPGDQRVAANQHFLAQGPSETALLDSNVKQLLTLPS